MYGKKIPPHTTGLKRFFFAGGADRPDTSEWVKVAAMIVTLGIAVWSVDQAGWVRPATSLTAVFVVAALTSFLLIKSRFKAHLFHILTLLTGFIVVFIQGLLLLPDPGINLRVMHMVSDIQAWWYAQVYGAPSPVTLHVALIFGYLAWLAGYICTWSLIKKGNQWVTVLLGILIVLVNLNFWKSEKYFFFPVYLAAAMLFLYLVSYLKNRSQTPKGNTTFSGPKPVYRLAVSLGVIIIAVSMAWNSPGFKVSPIADYARAHDPFRGPVELYWQSFFATVPGSKVPTLNHGGQRDLVFGGPLELSDQVIFIINTDRTCYWKTQVYDTYTATGWTTGETQPEMARQAERGSDWSEQASDNEFIYTLIPQLTTDVLPSVGEFAAASIPVIEKVLTPQVFTLSLVDSSPDALLPADIAAAAVNLRKVRINRRRTDQQISALLPDGLKLEGIVRSGALPQSVIVSRVETEEKNVTALSSAGALLQQKRASIAVIPPPAVSDAILAAAGEEYPSRITDRYLQLPTGLPVRIEKLSSEITADASTPFEKARDISEYLKTLSYNASIDAPPEGEDGVDYFLFTQKSGYCNYFASAATVLLRCSGVPARMVVGFTHGQFDRATSSYIIRDRDYHAWTEVYYPGQGWILLDTTPPEEVPMPASDTGAVLYTDYLNYYPSYPGSGTASSPAPVIKNARTNSTLNLFVFLAVYSLIIAVFILRFQSANRPRNKTAMYSRMVRLASMAGLGPGARQTELEFSGQLAKTLPQHADVVKGITRSYILYRYSRQAPSDPMEVEFKKTWPGLRNTLIKRIFRPYFHLRFR
ncbi:MAG: transglutaminase domain-containing protein [Dehalococcoidales bacterium]|nr:transglutaminase domain-containing protein [Dehalococcoidales bacterium]